MNQPFAGGWRFGMTSNDALAPITQNKGIDPEFLKKVASLGLLADDKKGALDQATQAAPLSGLLDAPGAAGWGGDRGQQGGPGQKAGGGYVEGPDGNTYSERTPAGTTFGFDPRAAAKSIAGGPLSMLASGVTMKQTPQILDLAYYGAPNMSWADALSMAAKANGGLIGDVSFGGGGDYGLSPGGSFGDYGSSLGSAAGMGLDANDIGDGFGFGGLGDW